MAVAGHQIILNAEPCVVTGELLFWRDVRENRQDEFVWKFENYERYQLWTQGIDARVRTEAGLRYGGSQGLRDWDNRIPFPWELGKER